MDEAIRCTSEHEWVRAEEGLAVVGLTDYAQSELGDIVYVELPEVGARFEKGEVFGTIESVKSVSDIYSPVSGEVKAVNTELEPHPEFVNQDCYHQGWIVKLEMSDPSELDDLMTDAEYEEFISGGAEE
ncbi:MAG: glycine cleavage system protein GcvH [Candidatus Eisenbacteria bacterium]|jgi:glycine cleavage system H protein|nr:glycine cleavage system protein GcvH [Candidatus Eisenbacteria bacterium]